MIRPATMLDIPALADLETACFDTDRLNQARFRYLLRSQSVKVFIYSKQSRIVGAAIILTRKNSKVWRLYSIAILPSCQRSGIARELSGFLEKECSRANLKEIRLEVKESNHSAINFYTKMGYVEFGRYPTYYEDGSPAIRMKKMINYA